MDLLEQVKTPRKNESIVCKIEVVLSDMQACFTMCTKAAALL